MSSDRGERRDRPKPDDADWRPMIAWTPGEPGDPSETRPEGIAIVPDEPAPEPPEPEFRFEPFEEPPRYRRPHPKGGVPRGLPAVGAAVPDMVFDGADLDGLTVRAASLRGDDHRYYGEPRQDSVALWTVPLAGTDALVACVADGVGSQPRSHEGSALACRLLRAEIERAADTWTWERAGELTAGAVVRVASAMTAHAAEAGLDPKALSTTLAAAIVDAGPGGEPRPAAVLNIGDGAAYWLRGGALEPVRPAAADPGAIVDSRTDALPGSPGTVRPMSAWLRPGEALVLCTDGLSNPMHSADVRDRLVASWSAPEPPGIIDFGWQLAFRAKSYGDDRSAVCIWGR
ncbi:hypothetical protein BJF79_37030 [Actinomadura sp. CNU-125]|uniref:protein phosphatase 2C domain-containing protein n=1 Tax=Actinomadura sp. CNU-125 TaxID=1904961 RepID=UPI0009627864|nr:protein phosphatase 2C domain-containing protein [Actinomadura sp. CNU-125]OLT31468.1 hypothetical protein BJF79_37030 [Actinomadura sp. CNU-125]